jgi:polyisoprenoid-binding protein YceI
VRSSTDLPANASQTQSPFPAAVNRPAGAQALRIDPAGTVVTVIVRRAGPLARLGHDHVITSADETGTVWLGATPAESSFELQLPVDRFAVDLPEARAAAGAEFAMPVPDDAREGTRRNMLRTEVLDAVQYPAIVIRSVATAGDWLQSNVRVAVVVKGIEREQEIPVAIERGDGRVVARGSLQLNQTDYGMTPFSVGGGAIQVADTLEVRFEIFAAAP